MKMMSLSARRELLASVRHRYRDASWTEKGSILDGFVAATGYDRNYASRLLKRDEITTPQGQRPSARQYDEQVKQALISLWCTANKICSKRLVPFLPELITAMENHGHLRLSPDIRSRLLRISPATVDRLLSNERAMLRPGVSTT